MSIKEEIIQLKVELFDIISEQEQLMTKFNSLNQLKFQKLQQLQELDKKINEKIENIDKK